VRRLLLWAARNRWLRRHVPRLWFAQRAVRRFMPGETAADALAAAERFRAKGLGTLLTYLGENVTASDEVDRVADHYADVSEQAAGQGLDMELSVKLTHLGLDLDVTATEARVERLAALSARHRRTLWIDMEGSAYTEMTVALYERLRQRHLPVGLCLQTYLHRTPADLERLQPLRPAIRLVKGAYSEPGEVAVSGRRESDAAFLASATRSLERAAAGQMRLGLGTHDVELVRRAVAAVPGVPLDSFEVQMLYGIRERDLFALAREGYRCRVLIAYGPSWYAWYLRRLAEKPSNVLFVLRQLLP
jgi:proline dehydrogenase